MTMYLTDYAFEEAAFAYIIIIQAGAILAVLFLYRKTIGEILFGFLETSKRTSFRLSCGLLSCRCGTGSLTQWWIESVLGDNLIAVATALLIGGIAMLAIEKYYETAQTNALILRKHSLADLSYKEAFSNGYTQCLTLWPGMSRCLPSWVATGLAYPPVRPQNSASFLDLLPCRLPPPTSC